MTDEAMILRAETMLMSIEKDHSLFIPKFPWLDAAWIVGVKSDIEAASGKADVGVRTDMRVTGSNKKPVMDEAKKSLRKLFRYGSTIYYGNKKKQKILGYDKMAKARNNVSKMVSLLEYAHSAANKNPQKNDLLNAGYTQSDIDNLQAYAQSLNDGQLKHTGEQTQRPVSSQERINQLNKIYNHIRTIKICAQIVFQKNSAKVREYRIYG